MTFVRHKDRQNDYGITIGMMVASLTMKIMMTESTTTVLNYRLK
jgi:hypothetical protein